MNVAIIGGGVGGVAVANLRHNVFNFDCLSVQAEMSTLQDQNNLYFAGGWTLGAGLHEECWIQGIAIASQIATGVGSSAHVYDFDREPENHAPHYMRRLIAAPG